MTKSHGHASNKITELVDLYPTLAELAGLTPPANLQGQSLLPLLKNPTTKEWSKDLAFSISRSGGESIRTSKWRFTHWGFGAKGEELYDLKNDPNEFTNLARDPNYSGRLNQLKARLKTKRKAAGYDASRYK
jgi:arylsulfatase A-like enzyme